MKVGDPAIGIVATEAGRGLELAADVPEVRLVECVDAEGFAGHEDQAVGEEGGGGRQVEVIGVVVVPGGGGEVVEELEGGAELEDPVTSVVAVGQLKNALLPVDTQMLP